jgi:hypothetical protein
MANMVVDFYSGMSHFAEYGPEYRRIISADRGCINGRDEALIGVRGMDEDLTG